MRDSSCDACVIGVAGLECIRSSSEGNFVWETWKCSQEIRFKTRVSARTIILGNRAPGTCMSSYRCHGPGNASDRARMKTFSFRLGDLDGDGFVLELPCPMPQHTHIKEQAGLRSRSCFCAFMTHDHDVYCCNGDTLCPNWEWRTKSIARQRGLAHQLS